MYRYIIMVILLIGSNLSAVVVRTISLEAAKALALEQNLEYQSAQSALDAAKWNKTNALSAFLPNLSLGGTLLYMDPAPSVPMGGQTQSMNKDQRSISLSLSQPLFMGGKLYQSYKMASVSTEMAELSLRTQKLELITEVEAKYYAVLQVQDALEIASTEHEQAVQNLELADMKLENGLLSRADHLRFQASVANTDIAVLQAQTAYDLALRDFANYLGATEILQPEAIEMDEAEILPFAELNKDGIKAFSNRAIALANRENQTLQILDKGVEISQRAHKIAKGSFLPTLTLAGSRKYEENGIDRYEFDASNQIMLNLSVPLLPQVGNYAASREAYYEAQKTAMEARSASDAIQLGIDAAAINLISTARQVKTAKLSLEITEDIYAQLSERFRLNMLSTLELMDAELMLSAARMAYTNAYYSFYKARLSLLSLMGTDDYDVLSALLRD